MSYKRLPTFSAVAVKLVKALRKDTFTIEEISDIISSDMALTAKVLRVANSPFFRRSVPVHTVYDAFMVIGLETAKSLALTFSMMEMLTFKGSGFDFKFFWKNSIMSGVAAETFAKVLRHFRSYEFFFIGFLQDIGVLALMNHAPDTYKKIIDEKIRTGDRIYLAERKYMGIDHQQAGGYICKIWDFPEAIYLPISAHHSPDSLNGKGAEAANTARILYIADIMRNIYFNKGKSEKIAELYDICLSEYSLAPDDVDRFGDAVGKDMRKILEFFDMKVKDLKSYGEIIKEANNELMQIKGAGEVDDMVDDMKDGEDYTEEDIRQLIEKNERLREDNLSGR